MSAGRSVTTTQQLDELPDRTVVLTVHENSVQIYRDIKPDPEWWHWLIKPGGPVTVLWEPTP